VAWNIAIEAAPWLVGPSDDDSSVEPKEFYERLRPFKDLIAEDIRDGSEDG
jgi:hypothetical protein